MNLILLLTTALTINIGVQADCTDNERKFVGEDQFYIPGPSECIVCVCKESRPKECEELPCHLPPPTKCKHWTVKCCVYTCHDGEPDFIDTNIIDESDEKVEEPVVYFDDGSKWTYVKGYARYLANRIKKFFGMPYEF